METTRLIEKYLDGTLDLEQMARMESRMKSDPSFRNLVNLYREAEESIRDNDLFLLHKMIEQIQQNYDTDNSQNEKDTSKPTRKIHLRRHLLRIAAIFIFVAAAGVIMKLTIFNGIHPDRIFRKYYQSYDADIVQREGSANTDLLTSAIFSYNKGKYNLAIADFDQILKTDPQNYVALFYQGLSYLGEDKPELAVITLKRIPDMWDSLYLEHRDWYLALALLKQGALNESEAYFKKIKKTGGYYAERASQILQNF